MKIKQLSIEGAWRIESPQFGDPRGLFMEWYRFDHLAEAIGHQLDVRQGNLSVSAKDVVRGIHFADVPPGQAKLVTCVRGAVLDVIVDLRVGSDSFGTWEFVQLDEEQRHGVYLAEGLGHGFCALTDDATLSYLCSATYSPGREHAVHPLDPDLGIAWPAEVPVLSDKDAAAPGLADAISSGLLPDYSVCAAYYASLSAG